MDKVWTPVSFHFSICGSGLWITEKTNNISMQHQIRVWTFEIMWNHIFFFLSRMTLGNLLKFVLPETTVKMQMIFNSYFFIVSLNTIRAFKNVSLIWYCSQLRVSITLGGFTQVYLKISSWIQYWSSELLVFNMVWKH